MKNHLNLSILELSKLYINIVLIQHYTRGSGIAIKQGNIFFMPKFYKEIMCILSR